MKDYVKEPKVPNSPVILLEIHSGFSKAAPANLKVVYLKCHHERIK